ncbi:MAG TPA: hypothetical protein VGX26_09175 [Solirubrobacteraceae bacterium]|nr:hypothetical protein [Solirubrobacteraceae bacterium]
MTLSHKRELIRATVESATVAAARGTGRLMLKLFSEQTASSAV